MKALPAFSILVGVAMLALGQPATAGGPPQPLTSCGQDVEGDVYLTGDLDCTGVPGFGVNLLKRATLELRGFSIINATDFAVQCGKSCDVIGPGSIVDSHGGIWAPYKLNVVDVDLINNDVLGIGTDKVTMRSSSITGSRVGLDAGRRAKLYDSTVTGSAWSGVMVEATIPYDFDGCSHGKLSLFNSTITGNGLDAGSDECNTRQCVDVVTCREPRLDETSSCGTSLEDGTSLAWGVCSAD